MMSKELKESDICKLFYGKVKHMQALGMAKIPFIIIHIANESLANTMKYQNHLKRMGVVSGAADYVLTWSGGSAFIEFKTQKGKMTKNQENFESLCHLCGIPYLLARSIDDGIKALVKLGLFDEI